MQRQTTITHADQEFYVRAANLVQVTLLAVGPANYAGQAHAWSRAVRRFLHIDAFSVAMGRRPKLLSRTDFGFDADVKLPYPRLTTARGRRSRTDRILAPVSHLALDGFVPLMGAAGTRLTIKEVEQLALQLNGLALVAHGGDIRDPDHHRTWSEESFFDHMDTDMVARLRSEASANRKVALQSGLPLFVSTPDLLLDLPAAMWLPVSVDVDHWGGARTPIDRTSRPRVLHAPSGPIKGSDVVDPVLLSMHERGEITYIRPRGVAHTEMMWLLRSTDIVVDQVRTGSYGAAAVEAMAAGKVVVGYVAPPVRALLPSSPPIVDAPAPVFEAAFRELIRDERRMFEASTLGVVFSQTWHDGSAAAEALRTFLKPDGM